MLTPPTRNNRLSLYPRLRTNQKLHEIVLAKYATFGVKGILLPFVHELQNTKTTKSLNFKPIIQSQFFSLNDFTDTFGILY